MVKGKISLISLILLFGLIAVSFSTVESDAGEENTFYVGGTGIGNYSTIQNAINAATEGDIVYVYQGTYEENIEINKTVSLLGENRANTIIDGGNNENVIKILADHVKISGFTVRNSGTGTLEHDSGIYISSDFNIVSDNVITLNEYGLWFSESNNNSISENLIQSNDHRGILLDYSNNNMLSTNTINSNNNDGIYAYSSEDNTISDNTFSSNGYSGIWFKESNKNKILQNTFNSNTNYSLLFDKSNQNEIEDNIMSSGEYGAHLYASSNNNILSNTIKSNLIYGISFDSNSNNNTISSNTIESNEGGIVLAGSGDNLLSENTLNSNEYGIVLTEQSNSNILSDNILSSNSQNGIELSFGSENNIIKDNTIKLNDMGIIFYSSNNKIYNNSFLDNNYNSYDDNSNTWCDSTSQLGNYWDDYQGLDDDGDNIGDTPYNVPGGDNQDKYPIIKSIENGGSTDNNQKDETPGFELILVFVSIIVIFAIRRRK